MNKKILGIVLLLLMSLMLAFASTVTLNRMPDSVGWQRQKYVAMHPELNEYIKRAILTGQVVLGMTKEQIVASLGMPAFTTVSQNFGVWIYKDYQGGWLLYFDTKEKLIFIARQDWKAKQG